MARITPYARTVESIRRIRSSAEVARAEAAKGTTPEWQATWTTMAEGFEAMADDLEAELALYAA